MDKSTGSMWDKILGEQSKRGSCLARKKWVTKKNGGHVMRSKRPRRILMKRRVRLEGSRRTRNGIERRVRTLKKLIPHSESMELDGLFRKTADYILSLQMRVSIMQMMVKALTGSDDE